MKNVLSWIFAAGLLCHAAPALAEEAPESDGGPALIENIRLGPHPDYTRIHIALSKRVKYSVKPEFRDKRIVLVLENTEAGPQAQSRVFKDKNVDKVLVGGGARVVEIQLHLTQANSRFIHFLQASPPQIILDIKGSAKPYLKANTQKPPAVEAAGKQPAESKGKKSKKKAKAVAVEAKDPEVPANKAEDKPGKKSMPADDGIETAVNIAKMSEAQLQQIRTLDVENKIRDGMDDYRKAVKTYQKGSYEKAIEQFKRFAKAYPSSKYLEDVAYLTAEAEFRKVFRDPQPIYEKSLNAYLYAVRRFPDSKFHEHALMKLAYIFEEMNYNLEARNVYESAFPDNPLSPYTTFRKIGLANLMVKENKYEGALDAYLKIIKEAEKDPKDTRNITAYEEARKGVVDVANAYFDRKDADHAIKIFEEVEKRWPDQMAQSPQIHYKMGEIYFQRKNYPHARQHFFDLVNIDPESENGHKSLNRIGDSYLYEGKYSKSLAVFDESARRKPGSRESQYGTIRIADIGIARPDLPLHDMIFDSSAYYNPFATYNKVEKSAVDIDILSETVMSRGIAFLREQRYLEAINQFKKLLPLGPASPHHLPAKNYIRQAMIFLVESYSRQGGHLPTLYTFTDYQSMALEPITNVKTLVQVGEAYQAVSMYEEATRMYEKAKSLDTQGAYTARIFLDLGEMHLSMKNYGEAELVARTFLNRYPENEEMLKAQLVLARAFGGSGQTKQALQSYQELLQREGVDKAEIHFEMGKLYRSQGQLEDAIRSLTLAVDNYDRRGATPPQYVPEAYHELGLSLLKNGQPEQAAKVMKAAKQLFPTHRLAEWNSLFLAESYGLLSDKEKATKEYQGIILSEESGDLVKKAADTRLKVMEWEKQFKDFL